MLMEALEAGGMSVVKSEARDEFNSAHSDGYYKPNPGSLYEAPLDEMRAPGWPRQHDGRVVKVVVPLLHHLAVHHYCVVMMKRDPEEIRQSYEAAFGERIQPGRVERCVEQAEEQLRNRKDVRDISVIWYRDVLANPMKALSMMPGPLYWPGSQYWPFDVEKAAAAIKPGRCRFKREFLTAGI
jgi:hypothetical protein